MVIAHGSVIISVMALITKASFVTGVGEVRAQNMRNGRIFLCGRRIWIAIVDLGFAEAA